MRLSWLLLFGPVLVGVSNVCATHLWPDNLILVDLVEAAVLFGWVGLIAFRAQWPQGQLRQAKKEQRVQCRRLDACFSRDDDYVLILGGDRVVYASPSFLRMYGGASEDVVGRRSEEILHPDDLPILASGGVADRFRVRTRNGEWRWLEGTRFPFVWEHAGAIAVVGREPSVRVHAKSGSDDQVKRLEALRRIDLAILKGRGDDHPFSVVVGQIMNLLEVDAAAVLLADRGCKTLRVAACAGCDRESLAQSLPSEDLYASEAPRRGKGARFVADVSRETASPRLDWMLAEGFSSYASCPLEVGGARLGTLEVYMRTPVKEPPEWLSYFETLAGQASIALGATHLIQDLQSANDRLLEAYDATLEGWVRAIDLRDKETEGHTQRVTAATVAVAEKLGISGADLQDVRRGALLHDIGKIGVPDSVLLKAGPLTEEEWAIMRKHPEYALEWMRHVSFLRPALAIPFYHHERWDGTGYPLGLQGEEIPLPARIFAIVDVWDALRSDRPYRKAWPDERVFAHLQEGAGSHFDPGLLPTVMETLRAFESQRSPDVVNPPTPDPE